MTGQLILYLLTCGPLIASLWAWVNIYRARQVGSLRRVALIALGLVSINAALAACTSVYYGFRPPPPQTPPWESPEIATLGLLFLLAPIGMIVGFFAVGRGTPKWLVCVVEIASVPLLLVGVMAVMAF
jgi:hypothetical protein